MRSSLPSSLSPPFIPTKMIITFPAALVHSGSYNKNNVGGVAHKPQKFISHSLGKRRWGSLRSRHCQFQGLVRTRPSFCRNFTWQKGAQELSVVWFRRCYSHLWELHPHHLITSERPPPPNANDLGIRFQPKSWGTQTFRLYKVFFVRISFLLLPYIYGPYHCIRL